jgi:YidC/Oxa1 family membrane protein insertase
MERRVFIAIVLSFLVLYFYQAYLAPPPPASPKPAASASAPAAPPQAPSDSGRSSPSPSTPEAAAAVSSASPEPQAVVSDTAEREIIVETAKVTAVFSNRGGRLLHWRLKEYRDNTGEPVDLVPSGLPASEALPFSLRVPDDSTLTTRLNDVLYRVDGGADRIDATRSPASVVFEFEDAAGVHVRKEFRFDPATYVVALSVDASNGDRKINPSVVWGPGPGDITPAAANPGFFNRSGSLAPPELILHRAGKVERIAINKISAQPIQEGQFRFVGVDDHYFMIATVNPGQTRLESRALVVPGPADQRRQFISHALRFPQPPMNVRFFVGPKQFDLLRSIDSELGRAVNYGMFGWLAVPLLGALKWLHGIVGNWGWSIVLLTVLINLAMFPLRHKSVVSMRRMQELQPQLKAIQDRYANLKVTDPARQKMNTEVMNLYREKGVNPASGCIPMLLMMPVLFAFYQLLAQSIELRGAAFGWWIKDLSQPDPLFIIPILVSLTMFWQQKMTPAAGADPTQRQMMMLMPIVFGFIFLTTAAGTALYWFVSNVWAIAQQYFTNWLIGPPVVHTARPAAERRLKNAGTGRTAGAEKHS